MDGADDEFKAWAAMIGRYRGPMTAKMKKCQELIVESVKRNDKMLVFAKRTRTLDLGFQWCEKVAKIPSLIVDGRSSLKIKKTTNRSERQELIDQFRQNNYSVCWAGLDALAEGMNIPEANHGVIMDYGWKDNDWRQAIGRMIRPQQKKTVYSYFIVHEGTIDEYMAAICYLKGRGAAEGIDYMEFDDFSTDVIPDIRQYADAIVDGSVDKLKSNMWLAVDRIKRMASEEGEGV